eukprot:1150990-Pelagomonas_calceolata.AAC.2
MEFAMQVWDRAYSVRLVNCHRASLRSSNPLQQPSSPKGLNILLTGDNSLHIILKTCSKNSHIITGVLSRPRMLTLHIPLTFYPSICTWIRPNASCTVWPDFVFASTLSKMSKLLGMTTFLLPVTSVMPKIMCRMNSIMTLSSASSQTIPYQSSTHHVQSFDMPRSMAANPQGQQSDWGPSLLLKPASSSRRHGRWDSISRGSESVLGAVRGMAQRAAA